MEEYLCGFGELMNNINETSTPTKTNKQLDKKDKSQLTDYQNKRDPPDVRH